MLAGFKTHFLRGVGGDDGVDVLLADRECDLSEQATEFDRQYAPDQLITPADLAEITAAAANVPAFELFRNEAVDFAFRNAVVPSRSLGGFNFVVVDPLLKRGIADA